MYDILSIDPIFTSDYVIMVLPCNHSNLGVILITK